MEELEYFKRIKNDLIEKHKKQEASPSEPQYHIALDSASFNIKKLLESNIASVADLSPDIANALKTTGEEVLRVIRDVKMTYRNMEIKHSLKLEILADMINEAKDMEYALENANKKHDRPTSLKQTRKRPKGDS